MLPDVKYCREIIKCLQKAHEIRYFLYIGGNDSSETARIVSEEAQKENYGLRCIHVPKTIDNDLVLNDHTPGFPSAARFIAQSSSAPISITGRYRASIGRMGRNAGFLTAAASFGRKFPDDGPHLIYMPERTFKIDGFLAEVKRVVDQFGRCVVAVSEGIHDETGDPIVSKLAKTIECDAFGNAQFSGTGALADLLCNQVKDRLGLKRVRGDTLGYLQRSFPGCVSDIDRREAREVAEKAVQFAMSGDLDGSVANRAYRQLCGRLQAGPACRSRQQRQGSCPIRLSPKTAATSPMSFANISRPLIGASMPDAHRLRHNRVAKIARGVRPQPSRHSE